MQFSSRCRRNHISLLGTSVFKSAQHTRGCGRCGQLSGNPTCWNASFFCSTIVLKPRNHGFLDQEFDGFQILVIFHDPPGPEASGHLIRSDRYDYTPFMWHSPPFYTGLLDFPKRNWWQCKRSNTEWLLYIYSNCCWLASSCLHITNSSKLNVDNVRKPRGQESLPCCPEGPLLLFCLKWCHGCKNWIICSETIIQFV